MFERFSRNKILMKRFICSTEDVLERIMDHRLVSFSTFPLNFILTFGTNQVIYFRFASFYCTFTSTSSQASSHFCRQGLERGAWWLKRRLTGLHMRTHQHPVHRFRNGEMLGYQAACKWLLLERRTLKLPSGIISWYSFYLGHWWKTSC